MASILALTLLLSACNNEAPCELLNCGANGACAIDRDLKPICVCDLGYYGEFCENFDPCLLLNCQNDGDCLLISETEAVCNCSPEFIGDDCSIENPCFEFESCQNDGIPTVDTLTAECFCLCPEGFIGDSCEFADPCLDLECPDNASCVPNLFNGTAVCECNAGWEGVNCDVEIREKYIGDYNAISYYLDESGQVSGQENYSCTISKDPDDVTKMLMADILLINNVPADPSDDIIIQGYGIVYTSTEFALPLQTSFGNRIYSTTLGNYTNTGGQVTVNIDYFYISDSDTTNFRMELTKL